MKSLMSVLLVAGLAISSSELAYATTFKHTVRFAPNKQTKEISSAVVRGDRDVYLLTAKEGQHMTVHITSLEDNAEFSIQSPKGKELNTSETEATNWSGQLPVPGQYKIIVGGTRGNATYKLTIEIQ